MTSSIAESSIAQLKQWRQGDVALGDHFLVFRFNPNVRTTEASISLEGDSIYAEDTFPGLVVVTQTCDIVRDLEERPFVEVSPLVAVPAEAYAQIQKRAKPRFAVVPAVADKLLVVDLDLVMSVEKPVLLEWQRLEGCRTDEERRRFSQALARKKARPAFPDDFGIYMEPLRSRLQRVSKKTTDEAKAFAAVQEIRVQASPDWSAQKIAVHFWFVVDSSIGSTRQIVESSVPKWVELLSSGNKYEKTYRVVSLEEISASEYMRSDLLDFDNLS